MPVATIALGLAAVVYGIASLTGGWMGSPPWWERTFAVWEVASPNDLDHVVIEVDEREPRSNRGAIYGAAVTAGLAIAAVGAWPRRRRVSATTSLPPRQV